MTDWHVGVLCFNLIQKEREVHYWFPMSSRDPAGASPRDLQLDRRSSECRKSQLIRGGLFSEINLSCRGQEWPPAPHCAGHHALVEQQEHHFVTLDRLSLIFVRP